MIAPSTYLMDGPLSALSLAREKKLGEMEACLVKHRAFGDRGDAIRLLRSSDFEFLDVFMLVDDAIYLAKQNVVAAEFCQP